MVQKRAVAITFPLQKTRFEIDCVENWDPQYSAEVTKYPVEGGSRISDHRSRAPKMLSFSGLMSDVHPWRQTEVASFEPFPARAYDIEAEGVHRDFEAALLTAHETDEPLIIEAGRRGYWDSMMITSLGLPSTAGQGGAIYFSLSLEQIDIAETQTQNLRALHAEQMHQEEVEARQNQANIDALEAAGGYVTADPITGAKIVHSPELVQRWSPGQGRGMTGPQPAGRDLAAQTSAMVTPTAGLPASWLPR